MFPKTYLPPAPRLRPLARPFQAHGVPQPLLRAGGAKSQPKKPQNRGVAARRCTQSARPRAGGRGGAWGQACAGARGARGTPALCSAGTPIREWGGEGGDRARRQVLSRARAGGAHGRARTWHARCVPLSRGTPPGRVVRWGSAPAPCRAPSMGRQHGQATRWGGAGARYSLRRADSRSRARRGARARGRPTRASPCIRLSRGPRRGPWGCPRSAWAATAAGAGRCAPPGACAGRCSELSHCFYRRADLAGSGRNL